MNPRDVSVYTSKRSPHTCKQTPLHLVVLVLHGLDLELLLLDLCVLDCVRVSMVRSLISPPTHVFWIVEGVKVPSILLRVERGHERRGRLAQLVPRDVAQERMLLDAVECRDALFERGDKARDGVPGRVSEVEDEVFWFIVDGSPEDLRCVLANTSPHHNTPLTFCQLRRFVHVSSDVAPEKGGKPAKNSKRMQPSDQ